MLDYYHDSQFIPQTDNTGKIIGSVERWKAHKEGILHKGFTVTVTFDDLLFLTKRKHPVFDSVVDISFSSHPLVINDNAEKEAEAVIRCLEREAGIILDESALINTGSVVYKAKDPLSDYIEHEYCTFYTTKVDKIPTIDFNFAYGYEVLQKEYINKYPGSVNLAPWVKEGLNNDLL